MRDAIILDDVVSWRRIPLWLAFAEPSRLAVGDSATTPSDGGADGN
jgi:hypothetical protein